MSPRTPQELPARLLAALNAGDVEASDLAIISSHLTIVTPSPEGAPSEMHVHPTLVARRQTDGSWLIVIDRPFKTPPSGPQYSADCYEG